MKVPRSDYTLGTLRKGLAVLEAFNEDSALSFTQVSQRIGESPSVVFRILKTLEESEYLWRDPVSRRYSLGLRVWEIGCKAVNRMSLREVSGSVLKWLTEETGQTSFVSIIRETDIVYLNVVDGVEPLRVYVEPGFRVPIYQTASGKAMAAFGSTDLVARVIKQGLKRLTPVTVTTARQFQLRLEKIRRERLCINRGERRLDVWAVAAPVFNGVNECVAAVGVTGPSTRFHGDNLGKIVATVRKAAGDISDKLGHFARSK